jgi:hypothetical protein
LLAISVFIFVSYSSGVYSGRTVLPSWSFSNLSSIALIAFCSNVEPQYMNWS